MNVFMCILLGGILARFIYDLFFDKSAEKELKKENARLKRIILGDEAEITKLEQACKEYSKTFNRQNDEIVSLRKERIKAKEIIKKLLNCWTVLEGDEIRELEAVKEAEQFLKEIEK